MGDVSQYLQINGLIILPHNDTKHQPVKDKPTLQNMTILFIFLQEQRAGVLDPMISSLLSLLDREVPERVRRSNQFFTLSAEFTATVSALLWRQNDIVTLSKSNVVAAVYCSVNKVVLFTNTTIEKVVNYTRMSFSDRAMLCSVF